jgi:hypothetical protein
VTHITPPSQPSLAPEGPTTQQQQLAAVQAQLPVLSCQQDPTASNYSQMNHSHQPVPSRDGAAEMLMQPGLMGHASLGMAGDRGQVHRQQQLQGPGHGATCSIACSTACSTAPPQPWQQHCDSSCVNTGSSSGVAGQSGCAANVAHQGLCDATPPPPAAAAVGGCSGGDADGGGLSGVVFLSNSMGSVEYAVGADSAVYLKRGEQCHLWVGFWGGINLRSRLNAR